MAAKKSRAVHALGCKRHIVVDIPSDPLHVHVHAANLGGTQSACAVLVATADKRRSIKAFSEDEGHRGAAVEFTSKKLGMTLPISEKIAGKWAVLP